MKIRFEISSIDEQLVKDIKKWCIDNDCTHGVWAERAMKALK
jgi:hypothetical protein